MKCVKGGRRIGRRGRERGKEDEKGGQLKRMNNKR